MTINVPRLIDRFHEFSLPVALVARSFAPPKAKALTQIGLLGIVASALNAAGYLALMPLIGFATQDSTALALGPWSIPANDTLLWLLIGVIVVLMVAALQLDYLRYQLALRLVRGTASAAAVRGLETIRGLRHRKLRRLAAHDVLGPVAFACGILMRQLATALSDLLELLVFLSVLLWLSPAFTALFLVGAVLAALLYARSLGSVTGAIRNSQALASRAREEINALAADLDADQPDSDRTIRINDRVRAMLRTGPVADLMENKLHIRREMKRGPMLVEYLFPVALVVFPLLMLIAADPDNRLSTLLAPTVTYLLLLRKALGLLQRLADQFMLIGRIHPLLQCYADLQQSSSTPRCPFARKAGTAADDATDAP